MSAYYLGLQLDRISSDLLTNDNKLCDDKLPDISNLLDSTFGLSQSTFVEYSPCDFLEACLELSETQPKEILLNYLTHEDNIVPLLVRNMGYMFMELLRGDRSPVMATTSQFFQDSLNETQVHFMDQLALYNQKYPYTLELE